MDKQDQQHFRVENNQESPINQSTHAEHTAGAHSNITITLPYVQPEQINSNDTEMNQQLTYSITELVSQLSAATLSTAVLQLNPPEFSGGPEADIHDWLEKFERATLGLPKDQKLILLEKAFTCSARAWYRDELQTASSERDWSDIKGSILQRFSGRKSEDRYYDRLLSLKYDKNRYGSLLSFADEYIHIYRKAHQEATDKDIIRACTLAIPTEYRGYLNLIKNVSTITTVKDLKKTLRRYDQDIQIAPQTEKINPISIEEFKTMMSEMVSKLAEQQATKTEETIAAFAKKFDAPRPNRYRERFRGQQPSNIPRNAPLPRNTRPPPTPCYYCGELHWNRDCPRRDQVQNPNLNGQGC